MAEFKFKNFKSIDGEEKYVASTMGWIVRIGADWVNIPEHAWKECYAAGCISEDQIRNTITSDVEESIVDTLTQVREREDRLKNIVREWYKNNEKDKFDKQGQPKTLELRDASGMRISSQERNKIWRELQEELE